MTECVLWEGRLDEHGYGRWKYRGVEHLMHRLTYEAAHGPLTRREHVHHKCETPGCYNLEHLELVSPDRHMKIHKSGTKTNLARLTEERVVYAMARLLTGEKPQSVANSFEVHRETIGQIWRGQTWGYLFE